MYIMMIEVLGNDLFLFTVTTSRIPSAYRIPTIKDELVLLGFWGGIWTYPFLYPRHHCSEAGTVKWLVGWLVGVPVVSVWRRIPVIPRFWIHVILCSLVTCTHASEKWRHEVRSPCVDTRLALANPGIRIWRKYTVVSNFVCMCRCVLMWFGGVCFAHYCLPQNSHTHTHTHIIVWITPNQRVDKFIEVYIYIYVYIYIDWRQEYILL